MSDTLTADALAWCMIVFLPAFAMAGPLRRDQGAAQAYIFVVLLHAAAAVVYLYFPGTLPPRGDAIAFHRVALEMQTAAEWPFGLSSTLHKWTLAHVYHWVGPSWLFASVATIYAFALSVIVLAKFMEMLDVRHGKGLVIFLFGALPTSVLYGSVPLREPFQVLFFMTACYALLRFRLTSNPVYLLVGIPSAVLMGMLHKGLLVFAPFLLVLMLMIRVDVGARHGKPHGRNWFHRIMALSLAAGFVAAIPMAADHLQGIQGAQVLTAASGEGGLTEYAAKHRGSDNVQQGRTAYGISLDTSSPFSFVYSMTVIFFYYLFMPFPWQIRNFLDIYAFTEVALRVVTFFAIYRMWRAKDQVHPHLIKVLMLAYLSMAVLWAAGTVNYGTATRHHMVHQWIVLLLGIPALVQMIPGNQPRPAPMPAGGPMQPGPTQPQPSLGRPGHPHLRRLGGSSSSQPRRLAVASIQPKGLK